MRRFLGRELVRPRETPPWAKAMTNMDIPPWQKESPFRVKEVPVMPGMDKSDLIRTYQNYYQSTDSTESLNRQDDSGIESIEEWQPPGYFTGEETPRRPGRLLPKHVKMDVRTNTPARPDPLKPDSLKSDPLKPDSLKPDSLITNSSYSTQHTEVRRSWPEPREKNERRIVSANYSAVEIHGFFGLIDDGSVGEGRMLIVHVPKWIRGYFLDIKQGDDLHVYHPKGKVKGVLSVLSTGRHKYYAPGRRVMTCTVCVSEEQWAPFSL